MEETVKDVLNIYRYLQTINAGEDMEKRESSYMVCGNINWYNYCGEENGDSFYLFIYLFNFFGDSF